MTGVYFSGTGNTKFCLNYFLDKIETYTSIYSIEDSNCVSAIRYSQDIVFAYPVYYSNIPKIVRDFIDNNKELWKEKNIYIIATMGLFSGDGTGVSARLFKKYGANIKGGLHLRMPDNIGDVKLLKKSDEENTHIIDLTCEKIDKAVESYKKCRFTKEGIGIIYHMAGLFGQRLYCMGRANKYTKNPKIDIDICIGCKECENICPMQNIKIENGKAVSGSSCTTCYRCYSRCPQQAITLLGKKVYEQHNLENLL